MKIYDYLDATKLNEYVNTRYVDKHFHSNFPLVQYTYGRKAVYDNLWDNVTSKCRGLIVDATTGDILARPFEKFFNVETGYRPETMLANLPKDPPTVTDKLDGSLAILYRWKGQDYIASKGSFSSDHARWSTAWYQQNVGLRGHWPRGMTPIFEMINPDINRIVVNYDFKALVLLALIDNETGEELDYRNLCNWAAQNDIQVVKKYPLTFNECRSKVLADAGHNEEGFVLSWPRRAKSPLRVKLKYTEYLRLHRLVSDISPKRILEAIREGWQTELVEWATNSTPWFASFVKLWESKLRREWLDQRVLASCIYLESMAMNYKTRKERALFFTKPENKKYSAVLFHWLDNNQEKANNALWTLCEPLVKGRAAAYDRF